MRYLNKKAAFTLVEVLVSIVIFVIITGVILANYRYSEKVSELRLITYDIEDSIRSVQNMSFSGQKINSEIPINGYGISIQKSDNSYLTYGKNSSDPLFDSGVDLENSNTILPTNIIFYALNCTDLDGVPTELNYMDIVFSAPRGSMTINGLDKYASCYISIKNTKLNGLWKINIYPSSSRIWTTFSTS